jgi:DNA-binding NarL/FixJ family response regulator
VELRIVLQHQRGAQRLAIHPGMLLTRLWHVRELLKTGHTVNQIAAEAGRNTT